MIIFKNNMDRGRKFSFGGLIIFFGCDKIEGKIILSDILGAGCPERNGILKWLIQDLLISLI